MTYLITYLLHGARFEKCWGNYGKSFDSGYFRVKTFPVIASTFLKPSHSTSTCLWRWNRVFRNVGM